ncbi:hypothetical protein CRUP_014594 [Coryphaenoides rupestris]|nr:hypothetical protein CRUP_014594 [Coryphaenoides rupestris]
MYAFCCVKDPNSGLPKYVLINWGAHVTINARAEEDVDPAAILAKVAMASGVNFNFDRKTIERSLAPGSVREEEVRQQESSKRVEAEKQRVEREKRELEDRQAKERENRDKEKSGQIIQNRSFQKIREIEKGKMEQQKTKEEEDRKKESSKRVEAEKQRVEREKRELEERQGKERQKREKENSVRITQNRSFQKILEIEKREIEPQIATASVYKKINARDEIQKTDRNHFWAQAQKEEEDRRKESSKRVEAEKQRVEREQRELEEKLAKERQKIQKEKCVSMNHNSFQTKQEMDKEITQQMTHTKEEEPTANRTHQNPGIKFAESVQKANVHLNKTHAWKLRSPFLSQSSSGDRGAASPEHQRPRFSPPSPPVLRNAPGSPSSALTFPVGGAENAASPERLDQLAASPSPELYQNPGPPYQNTDLGLTPSLPQSLVETEDLYTDVEWSDEFENDNDDEFDEFDGDGEEVREVPLDEEDGVYEEIPPVSPHTSDHTEINFDPDDIITGIEMVGDGWWRGYAPNGQYGLFPANYVELMYSHDEEQATGLGEYGLTNPNGEDNTTVVWFWLHQGEPFLRSPPPAGGP